MYKVLIVDDESTIRNGLKTIIEWEKYGFEVVGDAKDGEEALKIATNIKPDIVFADVNMPFMSGLDFAEEFLKINSFTKFVFISGYQDFKYVQKALQLNAYDYIIKPLETSTITKLLSKLKVEIDEIKKNIEETIRIETINRGALPELRDRFFREVIIGKKDLSEIKKQLKLLNIEINSSYIYTSVFLVDYKNNEEINELSYKLSEQFDNRIAVFEVRKCVICVVAGNNVKSNELSDQFLRMTQKSFNIISNATGIQVRYWDSIGLSYMSALNEIEKQFDGKGTDIKFDNDNIRNDVSYLISEDTKIILNIKCGDLESGLKEFDKAYACLKNQKIYSLNNNKIFCIGIISSLIKEIKKVGGTTEDIFGKYLDPIHEIGKCSLMIELYTAVREILIISADFFKNRMGMKNIKIVNDAIGFINENLSNSSLDLKLVAEYVNVSYNYFGKIFKNHIGESFCDYLNRNRIEKAKILLADTELKIYEIAQLTGFNETYYFISRFKFYEGVTPGEYRDKMGIC